MRLIIPMSWQDLLKTQLTPEHPAYPSTGPCRQDSRQVSAQGELVLLLISGETHYELFAILRSLDTPDRSIAITDVNTIYRDIRQWVWSQTGDYPDLSVVWKSEEPHQDMFGMPLTPGSYFVYAALIGRSAMLKIGRVVECCHEAAYGDILRPAITAVTVNPLSWEKGRIQKAGRPVTLTFLDRLVCVPPSPEWKKLLDEAWDTQQKGGPQ